MIVNSLTPYILKIGFFELRWYSLFYLIAFLVTWWWLNKAVDRGELNVTKKAVEDFIFYALIGVVLGARLFEVIVWNPSYYWSHPQYILAVWRGGLSFHGAFVGLLLAGWFWCKKHSVPFGLLSDLVTMPATFGLAIGRIGNFFNHELYGPVTNVPWCVQFNGVEGCRHPAQLYGAAGRFIMLGLLFMLHQSRKNFRLGFITTCFIFLSGFGRFFSDFLREDVRYWYFSTGQWLSFLMVIASVYILYVYYLPDVKKLFSSHQA